MRNALRKALRFCSIIRPQGFLEILVGLTLALISGLLAAQHNLVIELISGVRQSGRLPYQVVSPRQVLAAADKAYHQCAGNMVNDHTESSSGSSKSVLEFDASYNQKIDRQSMSWTVVSEPKSTSLSAHSTASCLFNQLSPLLETPQFQDSGSVLWIFLFLPVEESTVFFLWPSAQLSASFEDTRALWAGKNSLTYLPVEALESEERLFISEPYRDKLTGELVSTLGIQHGDDLISSPLVAVDVRQPTLATAHYFYVAVSFGALILATAIGFLSRFYLDGHYIKSWSRGWLCWALLFGYYVLAYLIRIDSTVLSHIRDLSSTLPPLLSIANNSFFLLAAITLGGLRDQKYRARKTLHLTLVVVSAWMLLKILGAGEWFPWLIRLPDVTYSVLVTGAFAWALAKILNKGTSLPHQKSKIAIRLAQIGLVAFFVFLAYQQVTLLSGGQMELQALRWLLSVSTKLGLFTLFYLVVAVTLYWQETRLTNLILDELASGVVKISKNGTILYLNQSASLQFNLPSRIARGQKVYDKILRSFHDAKDVLDRLSVESVIEVPKVITLKHRKDGSRPLELPRRMTARLIADDTHGRDGFAILEFSSEIYDTQAKASLSAQGS